MSAGRSAAGWNVVVERDLLEAVDAEAPVVLAPAAPPGFDPVTAYRLMALARAVDERIWSLARQGAVPFAVSGCGHEAAQIGLATALRPGVDYVYPYYRDTALVLALGLSPLDMLLAAFARAADPSSGGRQMPNHFSCRRLRIVSGSSPVGTQLPQAAGTALACRALGEPAAVVTTFGEGAASQGDFHEGLNFAAVHRLPAVFVCENNGWAISVPQKMQCAGDGIAARARAYGVPGMRVDGRDPVACAAAAREAVERARDGRGPTLLELVVDRLDPHTSSDDHRTYRPAAELDETRLADPVARWRDRVLAEPWATSAELARIDAEIATEVDHATAEAEAAAPPSDQSVLSQVTDLRTSGAAACPK